MSEDKENLFLSDEDLRKLNITDLKNYLRRHNQFVTGRKGVLIERAIGVRKIGRETTHQQDVEEVQSRNGRLFTTPLGESLPDPKSLTSGWSDDPSLIPGFSDGDIYNYFVLRMQAKRHLRAKVYFEDRHVYSVQTHIVTDSCSHCFVSSKVIPSLPSMKVRVDHTVWICMSKVTGQVNSADCSCTAGNGETCNHIAALMYALVDITNKKRDGTISTTSKKCKWNNPRKRKLSPKKPCELNFQKHSFDSSDVPRKLFSEKVIDIEQLPSCINIDSFKLKLQKINSKAGWLTNFEENQREQKLPFIDTELTFEDHEDLKSEKVKQVIFGKFEQIQFSEQEAVEVEQKTRGQSKNDVWFEERKWRITSSNFGVIVHKKEQTEPDNIIRKLLYTSLDNKYVQWGKSHEAAARMKYRITMKKQHKDLIVTECGLLVSSTCPHLAASPDGLVKYVDDSGKVMKGVIEIKCPASDKWRNICPLQCADDPTFFCKVVNGKCELKRTHNYYCQVQGQLAISGRQWCDFVVWTLSGMSVERIYLDSSFWQGCKSKLTCFYLNALLPELYSRRIQRGLSL